MSQTHERKPGWYWVTLNIKENKSPVAIYWDDSWHIDDEIDEEEVIIGDRIRMPSEPVLWGSDYRSSIVSSNIKNQDGIATEWLEIWSEIENWYGDVKKSESSENLLKRLQAKYSSTGIGKLATMLEILESKLAIEKARLKAIYSGVIDQHKKMVEIELKAVISEIETQIKNSKG